MRLSHKKSNYLYYFTLFITIYPAIVFLIYLAERSAEGANITSFGDSLWYSIITLTTIGYGDRYPITTIGRFISLVFVISSMGIVGLFVGQISSFISKIMEEKKMGLNGTDFEKHIVIINWNQFAQQALREVVNAGKKVAIVTSRKDDIDFIYNNFGNEKVFVLLHDLVDIHMLAKVNIEKAASVLLNFDDDTENLVHLINIQSVYGNLKFIISLNNPSLKNTFVNLGVTFTLSKNEISSRLMASFMFEPEVAKLTEGLIQSSVSDDDLGMMQYRVVEANTYRGRKYADVFFDLKKDLNLILVGISKNINGIHYLMKNPTQDLTIDIDDYLVVIGNHQARLKAHQKLGVEEGI